MYYNNNNNNQPTQSISKLLKASDAMFNKKTLERIFRTLIRGYLIPEFNLFRVKFYQRPCFEWSVDAAGSVWNKLLVKGIFLIFLNLFYSFLIFFYSFLIFYQIFLSFLIFY